MKRTWVMAPVAVAALSAGLAPTGPAAPDVAALAADGTEVVGTTSEARPADWREKLAGTTTGTATAADAADADLADADGGWGCELVRRPAAWRAAALDRAVADHAALEFSPPAAPAAGPASGDAPRPIAGFGTGPGQNPRVQLNGTLAGARDADTYAVPMRVGEIFSATVRGAGGALEVRDPKGTLVEGSDVDRSGIYPASSPLLGGGNATVDHVAAMTGVHTVTIRRTRAAAPKSGPGAAAPKGVPGGALPKAAPKGAPGGAVPKSAPGGAVPKSAPGGAVPKFSGSPSVTTNGLGGADGARSEAVPAPAATRAADPSVVAEAPDPTAVDPQAPPAAESTTADPGTAATVVGPEVVDPRAVAPKVADPTAADPKAADPTAVDPTAVDPTAADSKAADSTAVDPKAAAPRVPAADPGAPVAPDNSKYRADLGIFEPPTAGAQKFVVEFGGATIDKRRFGVETANNTAKLSPLSSFLPGLGLSAAEQPALEARIVEALRQNLSAVAGAPVEVTGAHTPEASSFGKPGVSRVIVGGSSKETGMNTVGIAESVDPGNFAHEETALVMLDRLGGSVGGPTGAPTHNTAALTQYLPLSIGRPVRVDFVGRAIGNIATHEAGHLLGSWHTDPKSPKHDLMAPGDVAGAFGLGPDLLRATGDDVHATFGQDRYDPELGFTGTEDTRNRTLVGLKGRPNPG